MHERRSMRPAVALGLAMFLPAFGTHGLTAGRTELAAHLKIEPGQWQMASLMAVFALASVAAYAAMGRWGDKRGLRRGLFLGVAAYLAAHVLLLVSAPLADFLALPPWIPFFGLRLLAGLAGGAITVTANALGAALYPPGERGRSLSLVWLGSPLAMVIGVPLPAYLGGVWSRIPDEARRWLGDPYAAAATVVALLVLLLARSSIPKSEPGPASSPAAPLSPLPPLRSTWWIYATSLLMPLGVFPLIVSAEPYATRAFGMSPLERGNLLLLLGAASVAGGLFSGAIADRLGRRRTLLLALALFTLLVPLLPWCGAWAYRGLAALLGFAATVRQGPFQALASYVADQGGRGRLSARVLVSSQFGISLGQIAGIALVRPDSGGAVSLAGIAVASTVATALAWLFAQRLQERAPAPVATAGVAR